MAEHRIVPGAGSPMGPLYAAVVRAAARVGGTVRTVTDGPTTALIADDATYTEWRAGLAKPAPSTQDTPPSSAATGKTKPAPDTPAPAAKGRTTKRGK